MTKGRLEAFSDGVIAILITIMVLELKVPHGSKPGDLLPLLPAFASYAFSFIMLGIYWNNHHHLLHAARQVNGRILWANLHLLFWLSLIPLTTHWVGETHFASWPVIFYGLVFWLSGVAYYILARTLVAHHGKESALAIALGRDFKGVMSLVLYAVGIGLAFFVPWAALLLYAMVAAMWLIPDRRIERALAS